ncbi:hypothetical protein CAPTEDRAFT_229221 [Capitella teleta]|uniref:Uncharacterized protein n=1 Tax=Capitella teleta TaxID=283909 RepID=R7TVP3_CAPTE|nr:hypothetical protein CAPTEDRAFT_229221 [Capitella teleta]|eukprot:ELT97958.1 hypothetical protein CAPTEDRAFT_229221 [Capitella teleta]
MDPFEDPSGPFFNRRRSFNLAVIALEDHSWSSPGSPNLDNVELNKADDREEISRKIVLQSESPDVTVRRRVKKKGRRRSTFVNTCIPDVPDVPDVYSADTPVNEISNVASGDLINISPVIGEDVLASPLKNADEPLACADSILQPSTSPPPTLTSPPLASTSPPPASTSPPPTSASPPPTSTSPPSASTSPSPASTSPPPASTSPPLTSTSPSPTSTSPPPASTSPPPASTSPSPASTSPPLTSTSPPSASTSPPPTSTSPPPTSTSPPPASTSPPPPPTTSTDPPTSTNPPATSRRSLRVRRLSTSKKEVLVPKSTRAVKRKQEQNIEDIYRNKFWRQQMPKEKSWETIHENSTKMKSNKRAKCRLDFDNFHAKVRVKRRRQKAVKLGWKPLTNKRSVMLDALVAQKVEQWDTDLSEEEKERKREAFFSSLAASQSDAPPDPVQWVPSGQGPEKHASPVGQKDLDLRESRDSSLSPVF